MAIEWKAWDKVVGKPITECFMKTDVYPDSEDTDDKPFEGDQNQEFGALLIRLDISCTAEQYITEENNLKVCQPLVGSWDPNWRQTVRDYALNQYDKGNIDKKDIDAMDDKDFEEKFDVNNEETGIKSRVDAIERNDWGLWLR